MKYRMINEYWPNEDVIVDIKKTEKTVTITPISSKPMFTYACIDQLWDKGKIVIREPRPGSRTKITRHALIDWGNGKSTLYPDRAGIPFLLVPLEVNDDH